MTLAGRALALAAMLVGAAGPVAAATLGIAWDANPDTKVVGYRVYVGTSPGQHTESFDVAKHQTSFYYAAAVPGQRYYFAVASVGQGAVGSKSPEISATAASTRSVEGIAPLSAESPRRSSAAVAPIASGLGEVTALVGLPAGRGLLVEDGARLLSFSSEGLEGPIYEAPSPARIAALAVDPRFETTGLVYTAEALPGAGVDDVVVVRHRWLAGTLGESAAIVSAGRQPSGTPTGLTIAADGDLILAQGPRVTRFQQDGTVVRSQPGTLGTAPDVVPALAWDAQRDGMWSVWVGSGSEVEGSFVRLRAGDAPLRVTAGRPADGDALAAGLAVLNGAVTIAVAGESTVFRFDHVTSRLSAGTPVGTRGEVSSLVPVEAGVDLVVVREPPVNGSVSYSLLRLRHADVP